MLLHRVSVRATVCSDYVLVDYIGGRAEFFGKLHRIKPADRKMAELVYLKVFVKYHFLFLRIFIITYDITSKGADAYIALANEVIRANK